MILIVAIPRTRSSVSAKVCLDLGLPLRYVDYLSQMNIDGDFEADETSRGINTLDFPADTTMKIMLAPFLFKSQIDPDTRIIFLLRTPAGVAESQGKVGMGHVHSHIRRWNYERLVRQFEAWTLSHPNPLLVVDTDSMIEEPEYWVKQIAEFTGADPLRVPAAAAAIIPSRTTIQTHEVEDGAFAMYQKMRALCSDAT